VQIGLYNTALVETNFPKQISRRVVIIRILVRPRAKFRILREVERRAKNMLVDFQNAKDASGIKFTVNKIRHLQNATQVIPFETFFVMFLG